MISCNVVYYAKNWRSRPCVIDWQSAWRREQSPACQSASPSFCRMRRDSCKWLDFDSSVLAAVTSTETAENRSSGKPYWIKAAIETNFAFQCYLQRNCLNDSRLSLLLAGAGPNLFIVLMMKFKLINFLIDSVHPYFCFGG